MRRQTPTENAIVCEKIVDIHKRHRGVYGSPRMVQALRTEGFHCNHKRVERLMRQMNIRAKQTRKFKATTNSKHDLEVAPNHLKRQFKQCEKDRAWVSDITYVWTDEGWLYLVVFIDLWSRKVLGWSLSDRMQAAFVRDAFLMACAKRGGKLQNLLVHSDRGSQYASEQFKETLKNANCSQSMSRKANCWDNAVAESFFGSLKKELIYQQKFATRELARTAIFEYVEIFYNRIRLHSALNYCSPDQFEKKEKMVA